MPAQTALVSRPFLALMKLAVDVCPEIDEAAQVPVVFFLQSRNGVQPSSDLCQAPIIQLEPAKVFAQRRPRLLEACLGTVQQCRQVAQSGIDRAKGIDSVVQMANLPNQPLAAL